MRLANPSRPIQVLFILILLLSAAVKLFAARHLAWEADYVPLIARGQAWLAGGDFPAVGTLSSVAAYNMPFLVWMQLPALLITDDISIALISTQLVFNLVTTTIIFVFGARLFGGVCGLAAALLFTFSETGISGAYTAWAQLLLPGFVVIFAYCLYLSHRQKRTVYVAATAAFMTHFSAVLLFGIILIFSLLLRSLANARGVLLGLAVSAIMLAPYLALRSLLEACFWFGLVHSIYSVARRLRDDYRALPADQQQPRAAARLFRELLCALPAGRNLFLHLITFGVSAGLILVRAGPDDQPTYYYALIGLQYLSCAYVVHLAKDRKRIRSLIMLLIFVYVSLGAADRVLLVSKHDPSAHTPLNLNLYSSLNDAANWIAADWSSAGPLTISYDVFPEMSKHWWIVAWHTVDPGYRMGMALDYLLASYHGLTNVNRNPVGLADTPDYIVTSAPGLDRYNDGDYQQRAFNAIYVLKPVSS